MITIHCFKDCGPYFNPAKGRYAARLKDLIFHVRTSMEDGDDSIERLTMVNARPSGPVKQTFNRWRRRNEPAGQWYEMHRPESTNPALWKIIARFGLVNHPSLQIKMHKKTFITKSKAGHYTVTIKRGPRTVFKQGLISCLAWAQKSQQLPTVTWRQKHERSGWVRIGSGLGVLDPARVVSKVRLGSYLRPSEDFFVVHLYY